MADYKSKPTVPAGILCRVCGYRLDGLSVESNCPECGKSIPSSLREVWLRYADLAWLKSILQGMKWIRIGLKFFIGSIVTFYVMVFGGMLFLDSNTDTTTETALEYIVFDVIRWMVVAATALVAAGVWRTLVPEIHESQGDRLRPLADRASALLIVPAFYFWRHFISYSSSAALPIGIHILVHTCFLITVYHILAVLGRAHELERRTASTTAQQLKLSTGNISLLSQIAPVVLLACWLGPVRLLEGGGWTFPTSKTYMSLFYGMGLGWLLSVVVLNTIRDKVQREYEASSRCID